MIFLKFFYRPNLTQKNWAEICPKWNWARTSLKENLLMAGLNPTAWAGLMFQPETTNVLVAGYCAQHSIQWIIIRWLLCSTQYHLIIFHLLQNVKTWIAHVLHANEDEQKIDRGGGKVTWNGGAWLLSPVACGGGGGGWEPRSFNIAFILVWYM